MNWQVRAVKSVSMAATIVLVGWILAACQPTGKMVDSPPATESREAGLEGGEPQAATSPAALAGTSWRLVEFQSMDDAIGTLRPEDPSDYTMRLQGDGTATMKLDCNSAKGTWSAEPAEDGQSGTFAFGPLAATLAICAPPSMGEQIGRDAEFVRSFLLRDGRLYLSLMADAGIYAWQQESPLAFEAQPDAALEAAILDASPDYTREIVEIDGREARYVYGRVDLNGDGEDEVFVLLMGSIFCGTGGCNLLLLTRTEGQYSIVNNFPISRAPVIVSTEKTEGWRNLMRLESGGGAEPSYVKHVFDGERYVEHERLPADVTPEGTWLLAGDPSYQLGIPLEPRGEVSATDALVPGTDFHATGPVPCARYEGQPMGQCEFGVKRKGNGNAEVTVFWPDGGTRVIVFEDGAPTYSDASAEVSATKQSGLHLITIGSERFEIVDAIVFGG